MRGTAVAPESVRVDPDKERHAALAAEVAAVIRRLDAVEKDRGRWREAVRQVVDTVTSLLWVALALALIAGGVRLCFVGSAWGAHARRLAEREAVAYVRATRPGAQAVLAACVDDDSGPDSFDMRCRVTIDGVRAADVYCDDDEPGHNDGCVPAQPTEGSR